MKREHAADHRGNRRCVRVAALALAMVLAACGDAEPYRVALQALPLPSSWELVNEHVESATSFCMTCPRVYRYYVASGDLPGLLEEAAQAVRAAGYPDVIVSNPNCDVNGNGALCSITARIAEVRLLVTLYPPGDDVDHLGISKPGKATIRFEALTP